MSAESFGLQKQGHNGRGLLNVATLQHDRESTALDVLQQRQQVAAARSRLPQAQLSERTSEQRLLVLWGSPAEQLDTVVSLPFSKCDAIVFGFDALLDLIRMLRTAGS